MPFISDPSDKTSGLTAAGILAQKSTADPLPADPLGQQLCHVFGRQRWDFIFAEVPTDGTKKYEWRTERRYPIKQRVLYSRWQDANEVIGVRFKDSTTYGLIDLDINSPYHPTQNPEAIKEIRAALETIGITRTVLIRSSWSQGLHLYFPLPEAVNTFNLAVAVKFCLQAQSFKLKDGHLELFPNTKAYGVAVKILYKGHRLPLQPGTGSCLLDEDGSPGSNRLEDFLHQWTRAADGQDMEMLKSALAIARQNHRKRPQRRLGNVAAWQRDLETMIQQGWTAKGQTNQLLKEIACYGVVFKFLGGEDLVIFVRETAINSPGYQQFCNHQGDIHMRSRVWSRSVEKYYWPLGTHPKPRVTNNIVPFNQRLAKKAELEISAAMQELEASGSLPAQATARAHAIRKLAHKSMATLYSDKNKPLWHPDHYQSKMPVMAHNESDSAKPAKSPGPQPERPQPLVSKELHPKAEIMKCVAPPEGSFKKESKTSSPRGVRGEQLSFPQVEGPILRRSLPRPSSQPTRAPSMSTPAPGIDAEQDEVIQLIQRQVRSLNWSLPQITEFIASRFEGKRRYQLSHDELILLLYHLQTRGNSRELGSPVTKVQGGKAGERF